MVRTGLCGRYLPFTGQQRGDNVVSDHLGPNAEKAWFGPFGFLVILLALLYALVKGPQRVKAVAVSLVSYFYLITLIPAGQVGNAAFFTVFFTVAGYSAAFSLPPWRFSIWTRLFLQMASFILLFYSLLLTHLAFWHTTFHNSFDGLVSRPYLFIVRPQSTLT